MRTNAITQIRGQTIRQIVDIPKTSQNVSAASGRGITFVFRKDTDQTREPIYFSDKRKIPRR